MSIPGIGLMEMPRWRGDEKETEANKISFDPIGARPFDHESPVSFLVETLLIAYLSSLTKSTESTGEIPSYSLAYLTN